MAEDIRKILLTQMKVTEENKTFFESIINPVVREWCFICMAEKMDLDRLKQICAAAENEPGKAGLFFMEERERNLRERYEENETLRKEYTDLLRRVEIMYERTHALEEGLTGKLSEAMQEKDRVFGQMIETKDMVIRDKEKQLSGIQEERSGLKKEIVDLKKEINSLKEENRSMLKKNAGMREKILSLEDKLKTAEDRISSMEQNGVLEKVDQRRDKPAGQDNTQIRVPGPEKAADAIQVIPYNRMMFEQGNRRKRRGFFKREDRMAEAFIRLYVENDDYSEEQKEYLIKCLEQGDPLYVIKEFASPSLSVANMDWLRRITYRRMR